MPDFTINLYDETGAALPGSASTEIVSSAGTQNFAVNTFVATVPDDESFTIEVTLANFFTYEITIAAHDEDVTFDIRLVPDSFTAQVVAWLQWIWNPCTYIYEAYLASSTLYHELVWSVDGNDEIGGEVYSKCMAPGVRDLQLTVNLYEDPSQCGGPGAVLVDTDTHDPADITVEIIEPSLSFAISQREPCDTGCDDCIPVNALLDLIPTWTINNPSAITPCTGNSWTWDIIREDGTSFFSSTYIWNPQVNPPSQALIRDQADNVGDATVINEIGKFTIRATLVNCCTSCVYEKEINICSDFKIAIPEDADCHVYEYTNCQATTVTVTTYDDKNNVVQGPIVVVLFATIQVTLPGDGMYFVEVDTGGNKEYYTIFDMCDLRSSYLELVQGVACECKCQRCVDPSVIVQRYQLALKFTMIFMQLKATLHKLQHDNRFYTDFWDAGGNTVLPAFQDPSTSFTMLKEYADCLDHLKCEGKEFGSC